MWRGCTCCLLIQKVRQMCQRTFSMACDDKAHMFIKPGPSLWILISPHTHEVHPFTRYSISYKLFWTPPPLINCFWIIPPHRCKFRKHTSTGMDNCCEYSWTDSLTGWCHRLVSKISYTCLWNVQVKVQILRKKICVRRRRRHNSRIDTEKYTGSILVRLQGRHKTN